MTHENKPNQINDVIKITGTVEIVVFDSNGIKQEGGKHNLVVTVGKQFMASLLANKVTYGTPIIGIGTNNTDPSASDTDLKASVKKNNCIRTEVTGTSSKFTVLFMPGEGTGTIVEAGLFNNTTMISRSVFSAYVKNVNDYMVIIWTINIG